MLGNYGQNFLKYAHPAPKIFNKGALMIKVGASKEGGHSTREGGKLFQRP